MRLTILRFAVVSFQLRDAAEPLLRENLDVSFRSRVDQREGMAYWRGFDLKLLRVYDEALTEGLFAAERVCVEAWLLHETTWHYMALPFCRFWAPEAELAYLKSGRLEARARDIPGEAVMDTEEPWEVPAGRVSWPDASPGGDHAALAPVSGYLMAKTILPPPRVTIAA